LVVQHLHVFTDNRGPQQLLQLANVGDGMKTAILILVLLLATTIVVLHGHVRGVLLGHPVQVA